MRNRFASIVFLLVLCAVTVGLYAPFASNALVFDDHNIFSNRVVFDYALGFSLDKPRSLPYFLIGFVHVLSDANLVWNRYAGIALHCLVSIALFFFLYRALARVCRDDAARLRVAGLACLWMALSPMAVYASGYLIQRTIVLATLFGLVSATLYLRAQQQERTVDLLSAALLAFLSAMSKEHAVLLPAATIMLTPLVADWNRRSLSRAVGYFLLTLPGAVWTILHRHSGNEVVNVEIFAGDVLSQFARPEYLSSSFGLWLMSAGTQLVLFWKYLFFWLVPNPAWMSADLRVDFEAFGSGVGMAAAALSFIVLCAVGGYWWYRRGRGWLGGCAAALLFAAIFLAIELAAVRVQEPFVLYRSFLWIPGYALLFALLLSRGSAWAANQGVMAGRAFWVVALAAAFGLFPLAQDRLRSFSSEEALWQDALDKLPRPDVPGADRIYYNLAGEAYKRKDYAQALQRSDQVIAQNPRAFHGYLARGTSLLALGEIDEAERAFAEAGKRNPPGKFLGYIEHKHCGVAQARGLREESIACLRRSAKMGYEMARFQLQMAGIPVEE